MSEGKTAVNQRGMTPKEQDIYRLGYSRESWCAVEKQKEQDWCRATRKHYGEHLDSSRLFGKAEHDESEQGRCEWRPNTTSHRERRHFQSHRE